MTHFEYIHHYTSIQNLALILKSKKIRFNRLDLVDDTVESKSFDKWGLSRCFFVSCWTDSGKEDIPLWSMYADKMRGVRLSLPKNPFFYQSFIPEESLLAPGKTQVLSPIPLDRLFSDHYFIAPTFFDKFQSKVEYVDSLEGIYENAINFTKEPLDRFGINMSFQLKIDYSTHNVAGYKTKDWLFQNEVRFVLLIFPGIPIPPEGPYNQSYISNLITNIGNFLDKKQGPQIDFFDVDIDPHILKNMVVTSGPLATESEKIIVEALLKEYGGLRKNSVLEGNIRKF